MVKPAGAYLDVLREIRERTRVAAWRLPGERVNTVIKFAAMAGAHHDDEEKGRAGKSE